MPYAFFQVWILDPGRHGSRGTVRNMEGDMAGGVREGKGKKRVCMIKMCYMHIRMFPHEARYFVKINVCNKRRWKTKKKQK